MINFEMTYDYAKPWPVVELIRVDSTGKFIAIEGAMLDNGNLSNGDEIQGDAVFSFRKTYNEKERRYIYLRVRATVNGKTKMSDVFNLNVFKPLTNEEFDAMKRIESAAIALYKRLEASDGKEIAIKSVIEYLRNQPEVKEAGGDVGSGSVWITYTSGIGSAIRLVHRPGTKGIR
jgi:hypothetical protein